MSWSKSDAEVPVDWQDDDQQYSPDDRRRAASRRSRTERDRMPPGLDTLKHLVVLMMENRSFDHMLGSLKATNPAIDGLTGTESNPDTNGAAVTVQNTAQYRGDLDPDPGHDFVDVDLQIFHGGTTPSMQGFIESYFQKRRDGKHSRKIMRYFSADKLPVLTTLATEFAVFNRWFSSIPGPTLCNRAFAHYGTSFGHVGMELFYANTAFKSIYERLIDGGRTAKLYYFDQVSSTMEIVNLLRNQPQIFGTYQQFLADCRVGQLPDYSFIEPNYSDHETDAGMLIASDQHPDHHVREGERFIASIYNAIRLNPALWSTTALLVTYDEHGGIYDHVSPPSCTPDGFVAQPAATLTGEPFFFDRLGVRVPAVLVSPWIPKGTIVDGRVFEHASIPATTTGWLLPSFDLAHPRSAREKVAETFLDLLTLPTMRNDCPAFGL
jgi:phospholipase C